MARGLALLIRRWLTPLKPVLVPLWNGGHRLAWRVGEVAEALGRGRIERCSVCGRWGPMLYRRWVVGRRLEAMWGLTARQAEALARKESCACFWCGSKLRVRRLAAVLLELDAAERPGDGGALKSVRAWAKTDRARALRIAEINRIEGLHEVMAGLPGWQASDYHDPSAPGEWDPSARHEDLMALSYADEAFDLVLSSETLEHVPDLGRALREIWRVLRPGGRHVFTAPVKPGVSATFARARRREDGTVATIVEPLLHHPAGDAGYPVFTEIGTDLGEILGAAGFEMRERFGPVRDDDMAQVYIARKRERS